MRILKGFKSCVLKVQILRELEACFLEVRILKSLEEKTKRGRTRGAEVPHLDGRAREVWRRETPGEGKGDWIGLDWIGLDWIATKALRGST
jgi:hypothetical protein